MIPKKQIKQIREELETCKNPLFFFHDDADGLSSFLLLYRFVREGKGIIVKTTPNIDEKFIKNVEEYNPDKIFVVDIALVEQEFIDQVKTKIVWIDHHTPIKREKALYFNPRIENKDHNVPVSYWCHKISEQDQWISMVGCIADWYWPDFAKKFKKEYPDLLNKEIKDPETALFESELGKLVDVFSFCLKGSTQDAMKCVKILSRIKTPYEILNQETPAGKYLYKRYEKINKDFQFLLATAQKQKSDDNLMIFRYPLGKMSFTKDVANHMLHSNPDKVIIIAREKNGELKMSIRSKTVILPPILKKALEKVGGFGGGHEYACGANVKIENFDEFIEVFKEEISQFKNQ